MTVRRLILTALALLLAAVGWSSTADTAYAGGPTSVLLVDPSEGRAAALYHSDADYQRLVDAINAYSSDLGSADRPASVSENTNDAYRLTWLIHDITIWRIDRIYRTADDGLWLQTVADEGGGDPFARSGRWHRVKNPEALTAVLTSSGVIGKAAPQTEPSSDAEPSTAAATSIAAGPGAGSIATAAGIAGLLGVVLGAAGALLFRRARAGRDRVSLSG
jgi:hypothetical protein